MEVPWLIFTSTASVRTTKLLDYTSVWVKNTSLKNSPNNFKSGFIIRHLIIYEHDDVNEVIQL